MYVKYFAEKIDKGSVAILMDSHLPPFKSSFHVLCILLLQPLDDKVKSRGDGLIDFRLSVVVDMLEAPGEVSLTHLTTSWPTYLPPLGVPELS